MYIYIYISIYIYILKKERNGLRSFAKERNILAFFYILCKRTLRSLNSFTFFAKERCNLCVLLGFISHQNLKKEQKRMLRSLKERKRRERSERKRTQCPTLQIAHGRSILVSDLSDSLTLLI